MKSIGWVTIYPYFLLYYFFPLFLMSIYGPHINFTNKGNVFLILIVTVLTLFISVILSKLNIKLPVKLFRLVPNIYASKWFFLIVGLIFIPVSIQFYYQYGSSFRYSVGNLSEASFLPKLVTLYKGLFASYILYVFILCLNRSSINKRLRFSISINTFNWILCANGAVDILWISIAILVILKGGDSRSFFIVERQRFSLKKNLRKFFIILITATALIGIVFFGYVNKVGFDQALYIFKNEIVSRVFYYMYYRLSVFISSLDMILERGLDLELYQISLKSIGDLFQYRLSKVFGFSIEEPIIEGLNRLNYLLIFNNPIRDAAGATPGPLAAFSYLPYLPLNLVFCAFYISIIKNTFSTAVKLNRKESITILSIVFFIIVNFTFLHNPFASFLKIGPELFRTLCFILAISSALKVYINSKPKQETRY